MKYLKLFREAKIEWRQFPKNGHKLSSRESKILTDLVGKYYNTHLFKIRVEDHYYYTKYVFDPNIRFGYYNVFDDFNELKDYVLYRYYMYKNIPEEYLKLLKTSKLDPSFDNNILIRWASRKGHKEIVEYLLNDARVDPCVGDNNPIKKSYDNGHEEIVNILLKDNRVRLGLSKKEIRKYETS